MTTDRIGALGRRGVLQGPGRRRRAGGRAASRASSRRRSPSRSASASSSTAPASAPPTAAGTSAPPQAALDGAERGRRHQRPPGRDRLRGRRHRPQARRRGGGEVRRRRHGRRLRHALLPRGHGHRPARRRAPDPLPRLLRGPPRRLRRAQPLDAAARHHRREEPGAVHGALGGGEPRQEGHDDLPRLRLRLRPPRLLLRGDAGAGRRGGRAPRHPADRDLLHPLPAAHPAARPRCSTTSWSARRS